MLRIGLTGGIGSGKSSAAAMFARRGVPVIDADEIAKQLVAPGQPAYERIIQRFGKEFVDADGFIDRGRLRRHVFDDPASRRELEAILHPRVRQQIQRQLRALRAPYCVIVIPLIFEANQQDLVDRILVIDAAEDTQVQRVAARSSLADDEIRKIIAAQIGRNVRLRQAHDVITNEGELEQLEERVDAFHTRYLDLAREQREQ
ncbi:MAG: dephospho-CoA kinase [Acidiferrobacterales bacterium]|jgi:dephospho-CoA kinase|nr:dephospho-CoA kinase [Nitrospira sp.]